MAIESGVVFSSSASMSLEHLGENAVYKIGDRSPLGRFGLLGFGSVVC